MRRASYLLHMNNHHHMCNTSVKNNRLEREGKKPTGISIIAIQDVEQNDDDKDGDVLETRQKSSPFNVYIIYYIIYHIITTCITS